SAAGSVLKPDEREALLRDRSRDLAAVDWSVEDVPLLDEAADLLGVPLGPARRSARRKAGRRRRSVRFARAVLEGLRLDMPIDPELLAERYAGEQAVLSVAQRARLDRTWEEGVAPWAVQTAPGEVVPAVATAVRRELAVIGDGRLAVITPAGEADRLARELAAALPEATVGDRSSPLDGLVAVLGVAETKGLEFDGVIVVEPAVMVSESERGMSDLYVALTRATRRLA